MRKCNICHEPYDHTICKGAGTWLAQYCDPCIEKALDDAIAKQDAKREAAQDAALARYEKAMGR